MTDDSLPKTPWKTEAPFRVGPWQVLPASGELRGAAGTVRLRPLLMDILLRLAHQPGEVVRRETLLEDVWTRRMVNDEVLSRAIAELRTALGDDAREARFVETIPKIGYRLVAPVEREVVAGASPPALEPPPAASQPATVAPLPAPAPRRRWSTVTAAAVVAATIGLGAWFQWSGRGPSPAEGLEARLAAATPLTSDPALELTPRFSHDGKLVAFALGEGTEARIVVQALDGSARRFVGGPGFVRVSPVFFPDGRRIAFWQGTGNDCAIVEYDLESTLEKKLVDCSRSPRSRFDISRDGKRLVYSAVARAQHPAGLWVRDLEGGGESRALTEPQPGSGDDLFPRFSPDGKRLAFFRGNESHRQLWVMPADDAAAARVVTKADGLSYGLAWLGNDGPILAAADWYGFRALNLVDLASGSGKLVGARGARFPDVGPGGDIVWENATYAANLWQVETGGGAKPRMRWPSTRYTNQPEFSPDGRSVAFSSNREGSDAIYVAALDGEPRRIASAAGQRFLRAHWSADGSAIHAVRITLDASGRAAQVAVRIPAEGGEPQVIAALGTAVNDVRESRDGKWLYWGELSGHAMRLMRAPVADPSKGERLPWPVVSQYQMNARQVVFAQPQLRTLTICGLESLACEPFGLEIPEVDLYHWTLGARTLYVRTRTPEGPRLARYDVDTRKPSPALEFAPSGAGTSVAATPDETVLLVVREEGPMIDLMIARR